MTQTGSGPQTSMSCGKIVPITPSDNAMTFVAANPAQNPCDGVTHYVQARVAGDIHLLSMSGDDVIVPFLAGVMYPIRARAIRANGTTATGIVCYF